MTALKSPVRRETAAMIHDAGKLLPIVVELHERYAVIRQKGRRHRYMMSYAEMYRRAAEAYVGKVLADSDRAAKQRLVR